MGLVLRVARTVRSHGLIAPDDRVAVAVSGGSDSVALVWLLREMATAPDAQFSIVGLIHVNHRLRGGESDRDEAFCRALAERLAWPIEVGGFDVGTEARAARRSVEATARDVRYRFFADAARRLEATQVATGHTLDDQAETVLLRLLRGTGSRGASGVRPHRGIYIRPLLECRRADLRRHLADLDEPFCEDSSNTDEAVVRNRLRHQLMPVVERLAPGGPRALARFATLAGDDEAYLSERAIEAARSVVLSSEMGVELNREALTALPPALSRRVVRSALEHAHGSVRAFFAARHVEAIRAMAAADNACGHLDLPGVSVSCRADRLTLVPALEARRFGQPFEVGLPVPGSVNVPGAGVALSATLVDLPAEAPLASGRGDVAFVRRSSMELPLVVRNRRPGDRFRPLGAPGRRKVQDVLVDRKVPRDERDRVPLVVDAAGRIVWIVGHAIADRCRVMAPEAGVVLLKTQPLETLARP